MVRAAEAKSEDPGVPEANVVPAMDQETMDNLIAVKVSEGIAAALPAVLAQIMASQSQMPQFGQGMGPSEQVLMSDVPSSPKQKNFLKHYRKDDAINGKHQFIDITKLVDGQLGYPDERGNIPGIIKGKWIHFVGGDFYATEQAEVDFIEWKIKTDPMSRIYEVSGTGVIPCGLVNCAMTFANEPDLIAHRAATHGLR